VTVERPRRADARRNRERVLDAAEAVFAAKGTSASTDEIARTAGVGVGTVFRHFPTKEALLEAVFVGRLQRLAAEADGLATADDPGPALFDFFARIVDQAATKKAFVDALAEAGVDVEDAAARGGGGLRGRLGVLLNRAQAAGAVRSDLGVEELLALLVGTSRAVEHAGAADGDAGRRARIVAVVVDGLRVPPSP
jgi:AcrR family transcriptional regulator